MRQLDDEYDPELLIPLVNRIFKEQPSLKAVKMLPLLAEWYSERQENSSKQQKLNVVKVSQKDWHTLKSDDFRYLYSESGGSCNTRYWNLQGSIS
jgi:hypothetical protein